MNYSFLKNEEGYRDKAYKDVGGKYTIGYGRTYNDNNTPIQPNQITDKNQEDKWFNENIKKYEKPFLKYNLPANQLEALVSYNYNTGKSKALTDKLDKGLPLTREDFSIATVNGKLNKELLNRRNREYNLYSTGSINGKINGIPIPTGSPNREPLYDTRNNSNSITDNRYNIASIKDNRIEPIQAIWYE